MTVAVSWNGNGRQFNADIGVDTEVVVKYAGTGGTPATTAAVGPSGSTAITVPVNKTGIAILIELPVALDFTSTELDELIYIWGKFLDESILETHALSGMGIALSTGTPTTSNYSLFSFFGSDKQPNGWERMALDPTKTRTSGAGTLTTSNITHIGIFANVGGTTARFDNLLIGTCDVGTGLIVTGTSTEGLITELLDDESLNIYGVVTSLNKSNTSTGLAGELTLGDDVGVLASTIVDENSKLFVDEQLYYNGGVVPSVPLTYAGLKVVGNVTGATSVIMGQPVGTERGRNGISIVGNDVYNFGFDRDDGNVDTSDWYSCSFENLTGILNLDGIHDFNSNTISECAGLNVADGAIIKNGTLVLSGQVNLNSTGKISDFTIINGTDASSILTTNLADVTGNSLTSDGSNHAVELSSIGGGAMPWDSLTSGYDVGVTGSPITPTNTGNEELYVTAVSGTLTINVGSNTVAPSVRSAGAIINVVAGNNTLTLNGQIVGALLIIYDLDDADPQDLGTELQRIPIATANETYVYSGSKAADDIIIVMILDGYKYLSNKVTLPASDSTIILVPEQETN